MQVNIGKYWRNQTPLWSSFRCFEPEFGFYGPRFQKAFDEADDVRVFYTVFDKLYHPIMVNVVKEATNVFGPVLYRFNLRFRPASLLSTLRNTGHPVPLKTHYRMAG